MAEPTSGSYLGFEGRVGRTFAGSEGWWPPTSQPPQGAPNIIVILIDDLGYADTGCYGSEIDTPNIDRLAREGVRYTNFHSNPMCSPTRASLLTGVQSHLAGIGYVCHSDAGFPGYAGEISNSVITVAESLKANGYATFAVGKWHLAKDSDQSDAGPRHSWPLQRGFDRYYGVLDAFTNLHHPHRIVEDNHAVTVDEYPEGYFFTDDITDRAISMIKERKASDPTKPFFLYMAHAAVHAPIHAKAADMAKYSGRYEAGWDALRQARYERQQQLGIVEDGVRLAPRNTEEGDDVRAWSELGDDERRLFARYMEAYAGCVDNIDQNLGRLRETLEALGEWDNTIVIFTSDNGASREGEASGTSGYYTHLVTGHADIEPDLERIDLLGGPQSIPHYPRGWAMAGNTPFRLYKINTHAGGHTVPFVISWPKGITQDHWGTIRRQYTHVTDVFPTLVELTSTSRPQERAGVAVREFDGVSFASTLRDSQSPSLRSEQIYECQGHRGLYKDGWEIVSRHVAMTHFGDHEYELFNLCDDPTELDNLAEAMPEKVAELSARWEELAWANQIYPLDEGSSYKFVVRPDYVNVYSEPITLLPGTPTLERWRSAQLIWIRSFTVRVRFEYAPQDEGVLVAHGDQGGGYSLWILDGQLNFSHCNGRGKTQRLAIGAPAAGVNEVLLSIEAPGGFRWNAKAELVGRDAAELRDLDMPFPMAPFEGIDVGIDRRSPVDWALFAQKGSFAYSSSIHFVRYEPGEPAPDSATRLVDLLRQMGAAFE